MNSTEYEKQTLAMIEKGIQEGRHGLDPKAAIAKWRPSYYSRDRRDTITFDASVEVRRPGEDEPFFYWVIECKHYSKNVPVDDAEEFYAKLQQIGGANIKGTIVSKKGFSSGAVEFCRSKGIGVWRYDPDGEVAMILQADDFKTRAVVAGLSECEFEPQFFGLGTNGYPSVNQFESVACEIWLIGQAAITDQEPDA